jgi:protein phosphatase
VTQPEAPQTPASPGSTPDATAAQVPGGEVRVKLFARTDVGQVREHNEDNFLVADLTRRSRGLLEANRATVLGQQGALFCVCDGMGGAAAGEIASQLAVDIIFERILEGVTTEAIARNDLARRLVRAVESAGLRIFQEAKADRTRRGMGTTVTGAALVDDHLFLAQVGDSRGYILRNHQLVQVTRDQSLVNQLIEAGQLTEEEAETFEHNNIILQALGTADTVQVDLTYVDLRRGDMLLLCSDGLSGMVRFDEIREILQSSQEPLEICKALTERANQAGGHDNITVIIVQFDGEGLKPLLAEDDPLKYRKYPLPEENSGAVAPPSVHGGPPSVGAQPVPSTHPASAGAVAVAGGGSTAPPGPWQEQGNANYSVMDEHVDIPGTHVPVWVVIVLVAGVLAILGVTAFLLMR